MVNGKLKGLKVGSSKTIIVNGKNGKRKVTFKRMKKTGSLQFRITKNVKV